MIKICEICGKEYTAKTSRQRQCGADECKKEFNRRDCRERNKRRIRRKKTEPVEQPKWNTLDMDVIKANENGLSYGRYMAFKKGVAN